MAERERVISGLEDFIQCYRDAFDDGGEGVLVDALKLLKEHEPRLLKPEELYAGMVVWVDQINWEHPSVLEIDRIIKYMPGEPWNQPKIPSPLGHNYKVFFRGSFLTEDINLYGNKIGWVAWSERPTDDQRKAVKWE